MNVTAKQVRDAFTAAKSLKAAWVAYATSPCRCVGQCRCY